MLKRAVLKFCVSKTVPVNPNLLARASIPTIFHNEIVQRKYFHASTRHESSILIAGVALMGTAVALQHALEAYNNSQKSSGSSEARENSETNETTENQSTPESEPAKRSTNSAKSESAEASKDKPKESTDQGFFASWFAKNFYDGGFEDKMSKREAALILGVRESATPERIKDAHRRILLLNHPDRGGSAYVAAKINEAKDLLMKGK